MAATVAAAGERHAILFGPERTGLDNDEVAIAGAIVTFPSNPAYASLNLAQAVLLCGYEWFKAAHGDAPPPSTIPRAVSPPAQREMLLAFFDYLEDEARRGRLLPARDQETRHAAQPAQHLPPDGADPAGRAHALGRGRPARRGAPGRSPDAQARPAEEGADVSQDGLAAAQVSYGWVDPLAAVAVARRT